MPIFVNSVALDMMSEVITDFSEFGDVLRIYRNRRNLKQIELVHILNKKGYIIDKTSISRFETGTREPPVEFIYYVALCLGLTPNEEEVLVQMLMLGITIKAMKKYKKLLLDKRDQQRNDKGNN